MPQIADAHREIVVLPGKNIPRGGSCDGGRRGEEIDAELARFEDSFRSRFHNKTPPLTGKSAQRSENESSF